MSDIEIEINELLDTTVMLCDEVAAQAQLLEVIVGAVPPPP